MNMRALLMEAIGTFALIFIGAGSICADVSFGGGGLVGVALAHGLALGLLVSAGAAVSGGHYNPAVTIAMALTGKLPLGSAAGYIVAQLVGGTVGAALLRVLFTDMPAGLGATVLGDGVSVGQGVLLEAVLTFFLVFVIFGMAVDPRAPKHVFGLCIGLVLTMDILAGGPLTGASMNPARSFGPAVISKTWADHWVYWVGPILGGAIGGLLYSQVFLPKEDEAV
jgi:MIP family channel proteins